MRLTAPTTLLTLCALATASGSIHAQAGINAASGSSKRKAPITGHLARRLLPVDRAAIDGAVLIEQAGRILAVGPRKTTTIPPEATVVDHGNNWLSPYFVDLHHHVSCGGGNDISLPYEAALAAFTIVPARQIGLDDRVGSLTVGKDADFLVTAGDPLDPRVPPSLVYTEGQLIHRLGDVR